MSRVIPVASDSAGRYPLSISKWNTLARRLPVEYSPGYSGAIWIDKETSRVLRIDMSAHDMPSGFVMQNVDSSLEYAFVKIGEENYLLPAHSQSVLCQRTPADAVLTFDDKTN